MGGAKVDLLLLFLPFTRAGTVAFKSMHNQCNNGRKSMKPHTASPRMKQQSAVHENRILTTYCLFNCLFLLLLFLLHLLLLSLLLLRYKGMWQQPHVLQSRGQLLFCAPQQEQAPLADAQRRQISSISSSLCVGHFRALLLFQQLLLLLAKKLLKLLERSHCGRAGWRQHVLPKRAPQQQEVNVGYHQQQHVRDTEPVELLLKQLERKRTPQRRMYVPHLHP